MSVPHVNSVGKSLRTPIQAYHPANAKHITACITYRADDGRVIARSERGASGILHTPPAIAWDAGVIEQLTRDGAEVLEVFIRETGKSYRSELSTMCAYGRWQTRFGRQVVLSLPYWQVDGEAEDSQPIKDATPSMHQGQLFEETK